MFIHLGEETVIQSKDVIAIIDGELINSSTILTEFIELNHSKNNIVEINGSIKSIVVTTNQIYFSPLATNTLKRRSQYISELEILGE
ncbi:extracellular matrix regulator RemB [Bacillus sp. Marseille-P3661]|uniref:extracellular matrix regulator RemB n=1 Tax=Bacillus sp. Marseille-P3661 TaxID=1936234 RepID=UPI000C859C13|nr:extracellular matrix/biofilm biosynthesis regulator RemA family protein [Bacillus sp. Marseille-P3661]